ncbi:hypothetical protein OROGR_019665 [Orobanche gracilis]
MSACCCRVTTPAAAAASAVDHPILRRPSSSTNYLHVSNRQSPQMRGAVGMVLRSRRWLITAAVDHRGEQEEDEVKNIGSPPWYCSIYPDGPDAMAVAKRGNDEGVDRRGKVIVAAAATVVLGVGNRVLYKLALVPLKHYPFFLAQLATFGKKGKEDRFVDDSKKRQLKTVADESEGRTCEGVIIFSKSRMETYVIVYFGILYLRYQAGKVTNEMLSLPKPPLIAVGFLEALAAASGMAAGAILSGAAIPVLSQSFLVWQLVLSYIFLGRRYRFNQLFGCFLVAVGVIVTVASGSGPGSLMEAGIFWSILMIISFLLQAADTVLKETIFLDAAKRLKGGTVDLFVVNSFGSAYQAVFICLLLPLLSNLWGIPFRQLPNYLKDGAACFLNVGTMSNRCNGAPLLPVLFVIVNMCFNISLLHLIKISSAVLSCLASTLSACVLFASLMLDYLINAAF